MTFGDRSLIHRVSANVSTSNQDEINAWFLQGIRRLQANQQPASPQPPPVLMMYSPTSNKTNHLHFPIGDPFLNTKQKFQPNKHAPNEGYVFLTDLPTTSYSTDFQLYSMSLLQKLRDSTKSGFGLPTFVGLPAKDP
ncbi:hypothetical protein SeMB42_g02748 [Synchytrium endobioticum]|uniref:Uncharacterized protein n=1 Tax=Synchytrium endobioticum TaxID=286115 RepID=A0A507DDV9_9FUNG|nr:hypothetical protein SeMB42_g02748 [Synchytrium endobioticum]